EFTGAEVVERARAEAPELGLTGPGSRILSGRPYDTWEGLNTGLYGPLATGGSVVLCRNLGLLGGDALDKRVESERATVIAR
ncbi:acyl-CoA synthetase, partial [Streptomyces sp. 13-12-16]